MLNIPEEVKRALRAGDLRKNYKMKVNDVDPDTGARTYAYTIDNDTIVKESVKIDERMATGKNLKFGLCEGSSLEFQYFDHPNINGKDIQVFVSIEYVDSNGDVDWYDIPMGWYTVDQCPVQWSTGIYKVTAYNKLKSQYLDNKANALIDDAFGDVSGNVTFYDVRRLLLSDYEISYAIEGVEIDWHIGTAVHDRYCGSAVTLRAKYGIDTPLSWANACYGQDKWVNIMPLYALAEAYEGDADLDPTKSYTFKMLSCLNEFEQKVYDTIKDLIDTATTTSGQTFVNKMMNSYSLSQYPYNGWPDFCGIFLTRSDDTVEKYTTIGLANNVTGVVGSFTDLKLKTFIGYKKIELRIPSTLRFQDDVDNPLGYGTVYSFQTPDILFPYPGGRTYYYYTDADMNNRVSSIYNFTYPDTGEVVITGDAYNYVIPFDTHLTAADLIEVDPLSLADITLREALSAVYEIDACYGKLDRTTDLFAPVELNQGGLYPQDTLYPADNLYPQGNMVHPFPSSYQKLWTDTIGEQSFRYLIITYKTTENGQEVEKTLQRTVNTYGTTDYNMSDNWLFRNLIWTEADVGDYADAMVLKMKDIRWFPFEMWAAGLPHIETGDAIEITDKNGNTHTSYVLTRTLDGIQNLQDTFINGELDIF